MLCAESLASHVRFNLEHIAQRWCAGVAGLVDRKKKVLALLSACLLALVPWMQISRAVSSSVDVSVAALAAVVAAGVAVHLVYLAFNSAAVQLLRIGGPSGKECECPCTPFTHLHAGKLKLPAPQLLHASPSWAGTCGLPHHRRGSGLGRSHVCLV